MNAKTIVPVVVILLGAGITVHHFANRGAVPAATGGRAVSAGSTAPLRPPPPAPFGDSAKKAGPGSSGRLRITPRTVLGTINGMQITLSDLMPVKDPEDNESREIDPETFSYLLDRAVDRILISQAAEKAGVGITNDQSTQLQKFRVERMEREPGVVKKINVDPAHVEFEVRDSEAFMLQTSLMEQRGQTPNVTPQQVEAYYREHAGDFPVLPSDAEARSRAWRNIDFRIRRLLAPGSRSGYQGQLAAFMKELRKGADIQMAPQSIEPAAQ